jgi:hypothetical protein
MEKCTIDTSHPAHTNQSRACDASLCKTMHVRNVWNGPFASEKSKRVDGLLQLHAVDDASQ